MAAKNAGSKAILEYHACLLLYFRVIVVVVATRRDWCFGMIFEYIFREIHSLQAKINMIGPFATSGHTLPV